MVANQITLKREREREGHQVTLVYRQERRIDFRQRDIWFLYMFGILLCQTICEKSLFLLVDVVVVVVVVHHVLILKLRGR